jgi:hypothetical protein
LAFAAAAPYVRILPGKVIPTPIKKRLNFLIGMRDQSS